MTNPIGWCTETWNPMTGCTPVSEACEHCYARVMANRFHPRDCCDLEPPDTCTEECRFRPRFHPNRLDIPLHWKKPRRVFVCSMSDLFHEAFTDAEIRRVISVMTQEGAPRHTYMVLTKRPERARSFLSRGHAHCTTFGSDAGWPLPNLWLGVTVENQRTADERIPILLDTPAAVRFVSCEPLLGAVDLRFLHPPNNGMARGQMDSLAGTRQAYIGYATEGHARLDWLIVGGETGQGARPMQPEWALDLYRQAKAAEVAFWWKGWGSAYVQPKPRAIGAIPGFERTVAAAREYEEAVAAMTQTRKLPVIP